VMNDQEGSYDSSQWVRLRVRPTSALTVALELELSRRRTARQWVTNLDGDAGTEHVFGAVRRRTVGVGKRVNYTLTPALSLQLYARPFVASGDYDDFTALVAPLASHIDTQYGAFDYNGNPDFNVHSFRTDRKSTRLNSSHV